VKSKLFLLILCSLLILTLGKSVMAEETEVGKIKVGLRNWSSNPGVSIRGSSSNVANKSYGDLGGTYGVVASYKVFPWLDILTSIYYAGKSGISSSYESISFTNPNFTNFGITLEPRLYFLKWLKIPFVYLTLGLIYNGISETTIMQSSAGVEDIRFSGSNIRTYSALGLEFGLPFFSSVYVDLETFSSLNRIVSNYFNTPTGLGWSTWGSVLTLKYEL
jgi:hypothetical protein